MLSCSGNDLAIPHNLDPVGDNVLAIVGGHLDVHSSPVALEIRGHLAVPRPVSEVVDLGFVGVYCSSELVDVVVGFGKPLVGDCHTLMHCGDKAVCDGTCGVVEVITILHVKDGLNQARGDRGVVANAIRGNVYVERRW